MLYFECDLKKLLIINFEKNSRNNHIFYLILNYIVFKCNCSFEYIYFDRIFE